MLMLLIITTSAHSIDVDLEKAIVLVKAFNTNDKSSIEDLVFKNLDDKTKFVVKTYGRHALNVNPGRYYLARINYADTSPPVKPLRIKRPHDDIGVIKVAQGSVTYVGDWAVSIDLAVKPRIYDWGVNYDLDSLKVFAQKYPALLKHKLNISNDMGTVHQVDWTSVLK